MKKLLLLLLFSEISFFGYSIDLSDVFKKVYTAMEYHTEDDARAIHVPLQKPDANGVGNQIITAACGVSFNPTVSEEIAKEISKGFSIKNESDTIYFEEYCDLVGIRPYFTIWNGTCRVRSHFETINIDQTLHYFVKPVNIVHEKNDDRNWGLSYNAFSLINDWDTTMMRRQQLHRKASNDYSEVYITRVIVRNGKIAEVNRVGLKGPLH